MTLDEVLAIYKDRLQQHDSRQQQLSRRKSQVVFAMLAVVAIVFRQARLSLHGIGSNWPLGIAVAVIVALIVVYLSLESKLGRVYRLIAHTELCLTRAGRDTSPQDRQSGRTGEELRQPGHLYDRDLNVLGSDSLFGLLATVRTGLGERGLAKYLLEPPPGFGTEAGQGELLARQAAIQELAPRVELREQIAVMGTSRFQQVPANFFDAWLAAPTPSFHPLYRIALAITSTLIVVMGLLVLIQAVPPGDMLPNIAIAAVLQSLIALRLRERIKPILDNTTRLANHIQLVSEGLALLGQESFTATRLQALQQAVLNPPAPPLLKKFQNSVIFLQQREKEFFMAISLLIAGGSQAAMAVATWKRQHAAHMQQWLAAWPEFEALNALATYAFENPANVYPEILPPTHCATFEAVALGHPLLPRDACITNSIALSAANRFYLISGSNMAGKSTLLRAIGLNAVLAYTGAPVRAASLRLSHLTVGASLALTDSLAESKSKFLAEVERLASIVRSSDPASHLPPILFLVDELFSGTNSHDRRAAAEAVLRHLLGNGAIGALSTHDLALTDLASAANAGANVHMTSPDPDDPLGFDYRLKPGVNPTTNALAVLRMMGLDA
jgi:hypothetical protein